MKCLKCGKELEDSMLFCPQCGTKVMTGGENNADAETGVPQNDSTGSTGPATPRGKQKKAHKGLFALIVAVVMLAVLLVLLLVVLKSVKAKKVNEQVDAIKKAKIGDTVKFGSYEQDNNLINGAEAIEWIVLDKKDGKYLLLSKYCLDAKPYNTELEQVTWETCTLRNWLNNDFYTTAFSQKERGCIATTTVRNADNPKYGTETSYGKSSEIITNKFPNEEIPTDGYRLDYYISDGKIKGIDGRKGNFDFVITKDGQLLIGSKHHYLGNAEDVVAAGQIKINGKGAIKRIDNLSGHYQPTVNQAMNYQTLFEQQGLLLDKTWLEYYYIPIDSNGYCGDTVLEYVKMIEEVK